MDSQKEIKLQLVVYQQLLVDCKLIVLTVVIQLLKLITLAILLIKVVELMLVLLYEVEVLQ